MHPLSLSLSFSCRYGTELRGNFQAPHPCFVVGAVGGAGRNACCYGTPRQEDTAVVDRQVCMYVSLYALVGLSMCERHFSLREVAAYNMWVSLYALEGLFICFVGLFICEQHLSFREAAPVSIARYAGHLDI